MITRIFLIAWYLYLSHRQLEETLSKELLSPACQAWSCSSTSKIPVHQKSYTFYMTKKMPDKVSSLLSGKSSKRWFNSSLIISLLLSNHLITKKILRAKKLSIVKHTVATTVTFIFDNENCSSFYGDFNSLHKMENSKLDIKIDF